MRNKRVIGKVKKCIQEVARKTLVSVLIFAFAFFPYGGFLVTDVFAQGLSADEVVGKESSQELGNQETGELENLDSDDSEALRDALEDGIIQDTAAIQESPEEVLEELSIVEKTVAASEISESLDDSTEEADTVEPAEQEDTTLETQEKDTPEITEETTPQTETLETQSADLFKTDEILTSADAETPIQVEDTEELPVFESEESSPESEEVEEEQLSAQKVKQKN